MQQSLQRYNIPQVKVANLSNYARDEAVWKVSYDYQDRNVYYLTNDEKEAFLYDLSRGANYVDIKGYILSGKFLTISLCEDKYRELTRKSLSEDEIYGPDGKVYKVQDN